MVTPQQPDPLVGQVLHGTYRVLRAIRRGGMGVIYEAENIRLRNVHYAVKVLQPRWVEDQDNVEVNYSRFRREAEIASALRHPNIVGVVDYNRTTQGYPYLVMELLEGEDLDSRLKRTGTLSTGEVCILVEQVGGALQLAHERGIIHRDLKPGNIFLADTPGGWQAKLLDFGISKEVEGKRRVTIQEMVIIGTAAYMSPEQARGDIAEVDHTSDIFALGTIVFRCLTGARPFDGKNDSDVRFQVCFHDPPALTGLARNLPPALEAVIRRAHAKKKVERYQKVSAFVTDFLQVFGRTPAPPVDLMDMARTVPLDISTLRGLGRDGRLAAPGEPSDDISTTQPPLDHPDALEARPTVIARPARPDASTTVRLRRQRRMVVALGALVALTCVGAGFMVSRLVIGRRPSGAPANPHRAPSRSAVADAGQRAVVAGQQVDAARPHATSLDSRPLPDLTARGTPDLAPPDRRVKRHVIRRPHPRPKPERQAPKPERPPPKKKLLYDDV